MRVERQEGSKRIGLLSECPELLCQGQRGQEERNRQVLKELLCGRESGGNRRPIIGRQMNDRVRNGEEWRMTVGERRPYRNCRDRQLVGVHRCWSNLVRRQWMCTEAAACGAVVFKYAGATENCVR